MNPLRSVFLWIGVVACGGSETGRPGPLTPLFDATTHYDQLHGDVSALPTESPIRENLEAIQAARPFAKHPTAFHQQALEILDNGEVIATVHVEWETVPLNGPSLVLRAQVFALGYATGWRCGAPPLQRSELMGPHPFIDRVDGAIECVWQSRTRSRTRRRTFQINAQADGALSTAMSAEDLRLAQHR